MPILKFDDPSLPAALANGTDHGEWAHDLVLAIEAAVPHISLHVQSPENPNDTHGHLSTCSDGTVEVVLREHDAPTEAAIAAYLTGRGMVALGPMVIE